MRGPDFDELVGEDLEPRERERLLRAHEALLVAGPPPELPAHLARPARPRRRAVALALPLAAALALAAAAFAAGWLAKPAAHEVDFTLGMYGTAAAPSASAELHVYERDEAGNWPMEMEIEGLPEGSYELVLTRAGKPAASCGRFLVQGRTVTVLNAPYRLRDYDGWAVIRPGSERILLRTDEL
jgi:hypothetical protein